MEINSFILPKYSKGEKFEYGVKLIPSRTLDRLTDSLVISVEKSVKGNELFNICFKKRQNGHLAVNKFVLTEAQFKNYINFLTKFIGKNNKVEKNIKTEFTIENGGKIITSSLNEDYMKISSVKVEQDSLAKVFFTLLKTEMLAYIEALKDVYLGKEITSLLTYNMGYLITPIRKKERDKIYLESLYIFIDYALDHRNRELFELLSKEVQRILRF